MYSFFCILVIPYKVIQLKTKQVSFQFRILNSEFCFTFHGLLDPKYGDSTLFRNVCNYLPVEWRKIPEDFGCQD